MPQIVAFHNKLLLAEVYLDRHSREVPLLTELVLKEATIRLLDVLWEVHEERKLWRRRWELRHILDFDVFALCCCGRIVLDEWQEEVVEL